MFFPQIYVLFSATVCLRLLIFPIVIKAQRNGAKLQEHMPEIMRMQTKIADAANKEETYKAQLELQRYMEKQKVNPLGMYIPMLGSGFVFTSMFFALRDEIEIHLLKVWTCL